jgi:phosphate transport system substrate-binding protein
VSLLLTTGEQPVTHGRTPPAVAVLSVAVHLRFTWITSAFQVPCLRSVSLTFDNQRETFSVNTPKRRFAMAGVISLSLVAAACGSDDDEATTTTQAAVATTAAAATTSAPAADTTEERDDTDATSTSAGTDTTQSRGSTTTESRGSTTTDAAGMMELEGGEVFVTGSSTVEPISVLVSELADEMSGGELAVTVEGPGTGDGFAKFCAGEADIADASRAIKEEEAALCEEAGIEFVELEVAIDGLTVATSPNNDAVECLDIPALYALVGPESEGFDNWSDASTLATELGSTVELPDAELIITGPGPESGTYDTFVEFAIADLAEEREVDETTRVDYTQSPNDNVIVEGIEATDTSLGWVGYAFYAAEQDRMKALAIDAGDGCVAPTPETIEDGTYPFSRSLYIYVSTTAMEDNPAIGSYVDVYLSAEGVELVSEAGYVNLPDERQTATADAWDAAKS